MNAYPPSSGPTPAQMNGTRRTAARSAAPAMPITPRRRATPTGARCARRLLSASAPRALGRAGEGRIDARVLAIEISGTIRSPAAPDGRRRASRACYRAVFPRRFRRSLRGRRLERSGAVVDLIENGEPRRLGGAGAIEDLMRPSVGERRAAVLRIRLCGGERHRADDLAPRGLAGAPPVGARRRLQERRAG